jgi:hypothetical protein
MKKATEFRPLPLKALIFSVTVAILGGVAIGFCIGYRYRSITHHCAPCPKLSDGYTVLDAEHVIDITGDTLYYRWKQSIQYAGQ